MTPSFWNGRTVLITGHTGFKGAWLTAWLELLGARVHGVSLPAEDADMYSSIGLVGHRSSFVDLRHHDLVGIVREVDPEVAFHLAAQSTVQTGYRDPETTFATNVMGTVRLLDALRQAQNLMATVVVTTDKVYGNESRSFTEADRLVATDPYAGSKTGQEIVVESYRYSYFRDHAALVTARAGNVIGGGDNGPNRLLPDCVRATRDGEAVQLRHPDAVRPWQHVLEPLRGYLMYAEAAATGDQVPQALNFGPTPSDTATVGQVAAEFLTELTSAPPQIRLDDPDPEMAENPCLTIDSALAASGIGWKPVLTRATAVSWAAAWYRLALAGEDVRQVTFDQIGAYQELVA